MPAVLNLSNEVVKMRAEVKRVKVLIIRKLTRQIGALRKKKGTPADLERNQRRAARLLEEVRVLKALAPDTVTKTALQSDISFEKVCKNKDASLSERAAARIATHPEFSQKIQSIKMAMEAFKAERTSAVEKKTENKSKGAGQTESQSDLDSEEEEVSEDEDHEENQGFSEKIQKAEETSMLDASVSEIQAPSETHSTPPEVTRMRKEVKKLRVLTIRKITQQLTNLKKAKAEDSEQQANQGCMARLQKEIQVLRGLSPDKVTRRALEGNIDLEKVFQDPESSPAERVIARIATHPRFVKKRQDIRVAIEEERNKAAKADQANETEVKDEEVDGEDSEEENDETDLKDGLDLSDNEDVKKADAPLKRCNVVKPNEDTKPAKDKPSTSKSKAGENEQVLKSPEQVTSSKTAVKPGVLQRPPPKVKEAAPPSKQVAKLSLMKPEDDDSESDLSDSEDEKEYFDDSTEERFHKQSSYSEQSDDDDDFFLGKVSKLKKKKSGGANAANTEKKGDPKETARSDEGQKVQEMSQFKMQTVFCSTLSKSSAAPQKGKHTGPKPARFQNQSKRSEEKPSWFENQNAGTDKRNFKNQGLRQKGPVGPQRGKPAFERPGKQQALHPSWEASRKRKEQQAQILAFQGKKIKFDDDD